VKVHASTAGAQASAMIVDASPEAGLLSLLPQEVISAAGLVHIRAGATSIGSVIIKIMPNASPLPQAAEKGGDSGASAEVNLSHVTQNVREGDGTLKGDLVVAVSIPATSSGVLAANGSGSLNMTVEFN
jgi:hypothetical protein